MADKVTDRQTSNRIQLGFVSHKNCLSVRPSETVTSIIIIWCVYGLSCTVCRRAGGLQIFKSGIIFFSLNIVKWGIRCGTSKGLNKYFSKLVSVLAFDTKEEGGVSGKLSFISPILKS